MHAVLWFARFGRIPADDTMEFASVRLDMGPAPFGSACDLRVQFITKFRYHWHRKSPSFQGK
jgi:hypothetical protein